MLKRKTWQIKIINKKKEIKISTREYEYPFQVFFLQSDRKRKKGKKRKCNITE